MADVFRHFSTTGSVAWPLLTFDQVEQHLLDKDSLLSNPLTCLALQYYGRESKRTSDFASQCLFTFRRKEEYDGRHVLCAYLVGPPG